jgi:hypothetical protein
MGTKTGTLTGYAIVVADRGWVYVGEVTIIDGWCVVTGARSVRRWGTEHGLGQLAASGPTANTVLDDYGTVRVPLHALISLIDTEQSVWQR